MKRARQILRLESRRGSVLVAVLSVIALLSFLVVRFLDEALQDLEYRSIFNEPTEVRTFTYSMMEVALATIHEIALIEDGKLYAPEQGWGDPLAYAGVEVPNGWEVSVSINDESGKLPLNTMSEELLNKLFEETFEFDFGTSRELSSALLDWIDQDESPRLNGAESDDYLSRNPPYRAADGPLQSLEELRLLQTWEDEFFDESGAPNENFNRLDSIASVYTNGAVNLNSVSQEILDLLALNDGYDPSFVFDGLDQPYLQRAPDGASSQISGVEVRLLRVTVSLNRGEVPFTISALVEPAFSAGGSRASGQGGRRERDTVRTGSSDEQSALNYPFKILHLSEYEGQPSETTPAARYSVVDIGEDKDSFSPF